MHTKTTLFTIFALAVSPLAAAHPGHAGHSHPQVLLAASLLAAGVLIVAARGLLLERDHRHRFGRQPQD